MDPSSCQPSKFCLNVDPRLRRQFDPRGLALLWPTRGEEEEGLLAVSSVCDDPDCETRDVQVWLMAVSPDLVAVELDETGWVELFELPPRPLRRKRSKKRSPEIYTLVDVDDGTVRAHPAYQLDPEAAPLLERLRNEMDLALLGYLRSRFDEVRRVAKQARSLQLRRGKPECWVD